jgi:hypothetical protein
MPFEFQPHEAPSPFEQGEVALPMCERLLRAAARLERGLGGAGPAQAQPPSGEGSTAPLILRREQRAVFSDFMAYLLEVATRPAGSSGAPFCRIILPPRTGKTVIAGHIIGRAGLTTTVLVPTRTLVYQTAQVLRRQLPRVPLGLFCGEEDSVVEHGVNIATYAMAQRKAVHALPAPLRTAALVFADEAHHVMTEPRLRLLREAFDPGALRIALTATPDYDSERRLARFFPDLIHEVSLAEALRLELVAPLRVWVAEVDADGSEVRLQGGDYESGMLGRLMSSAPFFRAVELFRYSPLNASLPALICCVSRQQAYDLSKHLDQHRPTGRAAPLLLLGETARAEREQALARFERGEADTLIQVGVLLEGWSSPRCKLLMDLSPSTSRVRATQKYFRVMTRNGAEEARIYVLLPQHLPRTPVLPMDLLGTHLEEYECGELLGPPADGGQRRPLERHEKTPVAGVRLKKRILLSTRLESPRLDPSNTRDVRRVLDSCAEFDPASCGPYRFQGLLFNHPLFTGRGAFLLEWLKVRPTREAFAALLCRLYPEAAARSFLRQRGEWREEPTCGEDLLHLEQALADSIARTGKPDPRLLLAWSTLSAEPRAPLSPERQLLRDERNAFMHTLVQRLKPRKRKLVTERFGLSGHPARTIQELSEGEGVSKGRVAGLLWVSLRQMRNWLRRKDAQEFDWGGP